MFNTAQHSDTNKPIGRIGSRLYFLFVKYRLQAFMRELALLAKTMQVCWLYEIPHSEYTCSIIYFT